MDLYDLFKTDQNISDVYKLNKAPAVVISDVPAKVKAIISE